MSSVEDQDTLEYYMFEHDKHMFSSQSGKQRSKKEAELHTNRFDPNGHSRKICEKLRNAEMKKKQENLKPKPRTRKYSEESDEIEE